MKNLIFTLIVLLASQLSFAQQRNLKTFVDAKNLAAFYEAQKISSQISGYRSSYYYNQISGILHKYEIDSLSFSKNPFVIDGINLDILYFRHIDTLLGIDLDPLLLTSAPFSQSTVSASKSIGSVAWQTAVLQGTADFMAERFKQELTNYALNQLLKNMSDSLLSASLKDLFPTTFGFLENYLKNAENNGFYYSDLNLLRYSAELDLRDLGNRVPTFIAEKSKNEDLKPLMRIASNLVANPASFKDPVETLNAIFAENKNIANESLREGLELSEIFMNAFRSDSSSNRIWVNWSDINPAKIDNDYTVRFFYALLYEQTKNYFYNDSAPIEEQVKDWVRKSIVIFERVDNIIKTIEKKKLEEITANDYKSLILSSVDIIDLFSKDSIKYRNSINSIFSIHEAIENREYKFILPNIVILLHDNGLDALLSHRQFFQTLNLFVDFTMVESADDMKALLETYALPMGSSSIKRTSERNISLNGYVGISGGWEFTGSNFNNALDAKRKVNTGLTAPIGIAISHRYCNCRVSSGSVFFGVIDLGSLVNANFYEKIETDTDLRFQQFLVPSLGYFINFRNSPLSLGFAASYHMDARRFDDGVTVQNRYDALRANFSLLVDIPLFTLHNRNYKKD